MGNRDHEQQIAHLTSLLEISKQMAATVELMPLLERIEAATLDVLNCERATVFLYDADAAVLYSKVATGHADIRFPADRGIAGAAAQSRSIINVPDAYADDRFNREIDKQTGFKTRNILAFCLTGYEGQMVGVLQALNKRNGGFSKYDEGIAEALSSLAGVAVQRQMLLEQYAQKQRMARDLAVARQIQQALLPSFPPTVPGYDIAGWNQPADETGGDCFDYFDLPEGKCGLLLADATGHGIGPALVVSQCRALIRALVRGPADLMQAMDRTNRQMGLDMPSGRFVTTFAGVLDSKTNRVEYISAGHGPLLHYGGKTGERREIGACTFPLGIMDTVEVDGVSSIDLQPGDTLILITDGFFEWADPQGEQFGVERIFDLVEANPQSCSQDLIQIIHKSVLAFASGVPQGDDLTVIVIRRS